MKFETILEYLTDGIKSDLDDIKCIVNRPNVPGNVSVSVKQLIRIILKKLDMICEQ